MAEQSPEADVRRGLELTCQPVRVATGEEGDGRLVFADDALVAVLVTLSAAHGAATGHWFLEVGFGLLDRPNPPTFPTLPAALHWITTELERFAYRPAPASTETNGARLT
jgi:hypothetical protein